MATAKETPSGAGLKDAVKTEVKQAQANVETGNVSTSAAPPQPKDLPTGARSRR